MKTVTILKKDYFSNGNLIVKETQLNKNDSSFSVVDTIEVHEELYNLIVNKIEVFAVKDKRRKAGYRFETGEGDITK